MHNIMQRRKDHKCSFCVDGFPGEGDAANNISNEAQQFLLDRYATQAPEQVNAHEFVRDTTEKDSWSVVGCASTEPTNTSYPITTHTPNVHCPANTNHSNHS